MRLAGFLRLFLMRMPFHSELTRPLLVLVRPEPTLRDSGRLRRVAPGSANRRPGFEQERNLYWLKRFESGLPCG
jgi:hypothetical protein